MSKTKPEQIDQSDAEYALCVVGSPTLYLKSYSPQFGWCLGPLVDAKCLTNAEDAEKVRSRVVGSTNGKNFTFLEVCRVVKTVHRVKAE